MAHFPISLVCAFFLFCLIDSEPATLLSPSKSLAIPYGSSSRRRLTPFLDRSVSVHRSGGCAINNRQPVTPISLHRASSLRDATLVLFSHSLLPSNSRERTHCRRYSMDHTVRPFLFASLTPVILPSPRKHSTGLVESRWNGGCIDPLSGCGFASRVCGDCFSFCLHQ